jgi:hypothetical protein
MPYSSSRKHFKHNNSSYLSVWHQTPVDTLTSPDFLYNELRANHWLDAGNYLTAPSGTISADVLANSSAWPVASSLTAIQQQYLAGQLPGPDCLFFHHHQRQIIIQ